MADILLGILAIVAGGAMLFAGQFVLRLVLPIWGFFAGFAFGAGLFAELANESFLGTALGWVSGFVFAVIFAVLAYLYYAVAVILAMAAFGYVIGAGLIVALGIDWSWVAVLVGVVVGAIFGIVSVVGNMPMVVLAVASSIAGAVSVVAGADAAGGHPELRRLRGRQLQRRGRRRLGLVRAALVLALIGFVAQTRQRVAVRRSVNEAWYGRRRPGPLTAARSVRGPDRPRRRSQVPPRRDREHDRRRDHGRGHRPQPRHGDQEEHVGVRQARRPSRQDPQEEVVREVPDGERDEERGHAVPEPASSQHRDGSEHEDGRGFPHGLGASQLRLDEHRVHGVDEPDRPQVEVDASHGSVVDEL